MDTSSKIAKCSVCGNEQPFNYKWCQKCNADMVQVGVTVEKKNNEKQNPSRHSKSPLSYTKGKILFKGHFFEYFLISLGLLLLSAVTFGIMFPYFIYWQAKYFVSNLEIEMHQ